MTDKTPVVLSWSGGKDSCVALYELQRSPTYRVASLLTTVTSAFDRISMHGVRTDVLDRQSEALGVPVERVLIPAKASNAAYKAALANALDAQVARGVRTIAFGDLFLEDIRTYRERMVAPHGIAAIFPIWGRDTKRFLEDFIATGFRAIVVCVDLAVLDETFAGRLLDADFRAALPPGVDPCGENGEFHTFVFDGPNFAKPVAIQVGDRVVQDGFCFCDIVLEGFGARRAA